MSHSNMSRQVQHAMQIEANRTRLDFKQKTQSGASAQLPEIHERWN